MKLSSYSKYALVFCLLFGISGLKVFSLDLSITQADIYLERDEKLGGYHLFVRQKNGIESILLCETTKDPQGKSANYAYRAEKWNEINGNEKRILDGKFLDDSKTAKYSLTDSSSEPDKKFKRAFHVYIPQKLLWGYEWARNGEVEIGTGTFVNIRTFEKPYADYSGKFYDNPFMFDFIPLEPVLTDNYSPDAADAFEIIAKKNKGKIIYSRGPESITEDILRSLDDINPKKNVNVVFAIDTTGSMKDDIAVLRKEFVPKLIDKLKDFGKLRLGLLLYRDYGDNYKYNDLPVKFYDFTENPDELIKNLNSFKIYGTEGGDIPEAVYEALYASLMFYKWDMNAQKKIILIGDAEPHPKPRGIKIKCTKDLIENIAQVKDITIDTVITPDDKERRRK
jgi:hypothetical protein